MFAKLLITRYPFLWSPGDAPFEAAGAVAAEAPLKTAAGGGNGGGRGPSASVLRDRKPITGCISEWEILQRTTTSF